MRLTLFPPWNTASSTTPFRLASNYPFGVFSLTILILSEAFFVAFCNTFNPTWKICFFNVLFFFFLFFFCFFFSLFSPSSHAESDLFEVCAQDHVSDTCPYYLDVICVGCARDVCVDASFARLGFVLRQKLLLNVLLHGSD